MKKILFTGNAWNPDRMNRENSIRLLISRNKTIRLDAVTEYLLPTQIHPRQRLLNGWVFVKCRTKTNRRSLTDIEHSVFLCWHLSLTYLLHRSE